MPTKDFTTKSKHLFLTYASVDKHYSGRNDALEGFKEYLELSDSPWTPTEVSYCVEYYPEDVIRFHLHALITFSQPLYHNITKYWSWCHIQPRCDKVSCSKKSIEQLVKYLGKGNGSPSEPKDSCVTIGHILEDTGPTWATVLACPDRESAIKLIKTNFAKQYFSSFGNIMAAIDANFYVRAEPYVSNPEWEFHLPEPIVAWTENDLLSVSAFLFFSY